MKKKTISLVLLAALLLSTVSCGSDTDKFPDSDESIDTTTAEVTTTPEYDYPEYDGEGKDFTILNASNTWGFYTNIDLEEVTGESLDDAVFARNRDVEEHFNVTLSLVEEDMNSVAQKYQTSLLSGDYEYDAAFIPTIHMATAITEGYLYNLLDYPEFRLDEEYYDQSVNAAARVGSKSSQYFAYTYTSLSALDGALCIFFNETMLENLNLETPYQLVRDGEWTLDKLGEYISAGINLNGDENFTWNENGNAVYGLTSWADGFGAFVAGADVNFVTLDKENQPVFRVEERTYDVLDKIDTIFQGDGAFISRNNAGNDYYEMIFKNSRALFLLAELKASSKYRDMGDSFGLLPLPKYDETQEEYCTYRSRYELLMSVPVTNPAPERAGIILDAMAYKSFKDILPIYYDYRVSRKQLRNDESVEMLDIIRRTLNFDTGFPYGWTFQLYTVLSHAISNKSGGYASTIASYEASIKASIAQTMEHMNQ